MVIRVRYFYRWTDGHRKISRRSMVNSTLVRWRKHRSWLGRSTSGYLGSSGLRRRRKDGHCHLQGRRMVYPAIIRWRKHNRSLGEEGLTTYRYRRITMEMVRQTLRFTGTVHGLSNDLRTAERQ